MTKNSTILPLYGWHGGKRRLLPEILPLIPPLEGHRYYEPFVGAGSVFLALQPDEATISDLNFELMNLYSIVQRSPDDLIYRLKEYEREDYNSRAYYYKVRALDRDKEAYARMSHVEKAARFLYIMKIGRRNLYRVNSKGFINTPFGDEPARQLCDEPEIRAMHEYFKPLFVRLLHCDFEVAVKDARRGDFVYLDPPYYREGGRGFTEYCSDGFKEADHVRLRDCIVTLSGRGVKCLLSSSDAPFMRDLYVGKSLFNVKEIECSRTISAGTSGAMSAAELLIYNYEAPPVALARQASLF
jgi:DNA adenine methylase